MTVNLDNSQLDIRNVSTNYINPVRNYFKTIFKYIKCLFMYVNKVENLNLNKILYKHFTIDPSHAELKALV